MMAMSEESGFGKLALKIVGTAVLVIAFAYSLGVVVGASEALLEGRGGTSRVLRIVLAAVAAAVCVWGVVRLKPWARSAEPVSPRTRKANNLFLLASAIGGLLGAVLVIGTVSMDEPFAMFSNSTIKPSIAIIATVGWVIALLLSLQWHRTVDEHEAEAYEFGGLAGLYIYALLAPAWWLAARGGLLPAPDTMVIFLIVTGVWTIVWFWRRYR